MGTVDMTIGRLVYNPAQVAHGQVRKTEGSVAAARIHPNPGAEVAHREGGAI